MVTSTTGQRQGQECGRHGSIWIDDDDGVAAAAPCRDLRYLRSVLFDVQWVLLSHFSSGRAWLVATCCCAFLVVAVARLVEEMRIGNVFSREQLQ